MFFLENCWAWEPKFAYFFKRFNRFFQTLSFLYWEFKQMCVNMEKKKTGKLTNLIVKLTQAAKESKSRKASTSKKFSPASSQKWEANLSKIINTQIIPQ